MKNLQRIIDWIWRVSAPHYGVFALMLLACSVACAQVERDVTPEAVHEIARRGPMVQLTGTIRSSLLTAALAPPADDSAKWFVTLVVDTGPDSLQMREVIEKDSDIRPWIDAVNAAKSPTHYQVRLVTDATQADWLKGVLPAIKKFGLPCIVLQPPRNGQFGPGSTIVKTIHGTCDGKYLAAKFRESVIAYIAAIESPNDSGIGITPPYVEPVTVPAPFARPAVAPVPPPQTQPFEFPPSKPTELTVEQIESACPGATNAFIVATIKSKETDLRFVKQAWLMEQWKNPTPTEVPYQPTPRDSEGEVVPAKPFFTQGKTDYTPYALAAVVVICLAWKSARGIGVRLGNAYAAFTKTSDPKELTPAPLSLTPAPTPATNALPTG